MNIRTSIATMVAASALALTSGCSVMRGQESAGAYVDDASITSSIKAKMVEDKTVDASAISVETMQGTVMLSGFAKDATEKHNAETIAMKTKGVKSVQNNITVKP